MTIQLENHFSDDDEGYEHNLGEELLGMEKATQLKNFCAKVKDFFCWR